MYTIIQSVRFLSPLLLLLATQSTAFAPPARPPLANSHVLDGSKIATFSRKSSLLHSARGDIPKGELSYGEASRRFRRTYYTEDDWVDHRAQDRFLGNLIRTFRSGIVRALATEIGSVAALSVLVCLYNALIVTGYQDFHGDMHDPFILMFDAPLPIASLPLEPFSLSSPALGLLLVFRTNASYARWLEARNKWSSVVNYSRNIVRLGAGWMNPDLPEETQRELLEDLADTAWVYSRSLQRHLLGSHEDGETYCQDVRERMSPQVAQALIKAPHKPNRALFELTKAVNAIPMTEHRHVEMDKGVEHLAETLGGCERIYASPVPLVYTRHTARFLGFWILALPLALWNAFEPSWNHLGLVPAAVLISFFFFGIEELAIQLEEPFSILPLQQLVKNVENSVDETVQWFLEETLGTQTQVHEQKSTLSEVSK